MPGTNGYLADALIDASSYSDCVAVLLSIQSWDDMVPWCLSCPDSQDCWAWSAMQVLTSQEIIEAKRRHRIRKSRMWARSWGGRPRSLIEVVKDGGRA
jgi:hypothetical protein